MKLTRTTSATFWKEEKSKNSLLRHSKSLPQIDELTQSAPEPVKSRWGPRLFIAHLLPKKRYPKFLARESSVEDLTATLLPAFEIVERNYPPLRRLRNGNATNHDKANTYTPYRWPDTIIAEPVSPVPSSNSSTLFSSGSPGGRVPRTPPALLRDFSPSTTWGRLRQVLHHVSRRKRPVGGFIDEKLQKTAPRREYVEAEFMGTG